MSVLPQVPLETLTTAFGTPLRDVTMSLFEALEKFPLNLKSKNSETATDLHVGERLLAHISFEASQNKQIARIFRAYCMKWMSGPENREYLLGLAILTLLPIVNRPPYGIMKGV